MTTLSSLPALADPSTTDAPDMELDEAKEKTLSDAGDPRDADDLESTTSRTSVSPRQHLTRVQWALTVVGIWLGALLFGLDTTIAADVQASVYQSFGDLQKLPWVGIGFPMGSVAVILLLGKSYERFEIKWLFMGSFTLFEIGSALCGAAQNANMLIFGRVIAGIGGAGTYLGALTYIAFFTTLRERGLYNASIGLAWGIGAILGPVIGGAFSDSSATWRWAFYINLPLFAFLLPVYIFAYPRFNPVPNASGPSKLAKMDWVGAVLNAASFVLLMVALTFSGSTWKWSSGSAIVTWVILVVVVMLYAIQQTFCLFTTEQDRLFPVHFLKSRTMVLLYFTTATSATAVGVMFYYIPLFFQFTKGDTALDAAIRLLPFVIIYIFFVMFSGALLPIFGRYGPVYFPAGILMVVGGALLFTVTPSTHTAAIYGYEIMVAAGGGLIFQIAYGVAATKVASHDVGAATGFINVAQIGSTAIALSIAGCLFQNLGVHYLKEAFAGYNYPDTYLASALAGADSPILMHSDAAMRALAIGAIVKTISRVFALVISAGALTFVSACGMSWEKLDFKPAAGG